MNKEFVPYELALKIKELGFDEPCLAVYNNPDFKWVRHLFGWEDDELENVTNTKFANEGFVTTPTYSQCFRWFREKYDMIHNIDRIFKDEFGYIITPGDKQPINAFNFNSYEEAELACLENLIELVESKSE